MIPRKGHFAFDYSVMDSPDFVVFYTSLYDIHESQLMEPGAGAGAGTGTGTGWIRTRISVIGTIVQTTFFSSEKGVERLWNSVGSRTAVAGEALALRRTGIMVIMAQYRLEVCADPEASGVLLHRMAVAALGHARLKSFERGAWMPGLLLCRVQSIHHLLRLAWRIGVRSAHF